MSTITIDPAIAFMALVAAGGAGALIIWVFVRGHIPLGAAELLAQAAAEITTYLGNTFTEDDVRALASWFYDNWLQGSDYYTREQFVNAVARAILNARATAPAMRAAVAQDGVGETMEGDHVHSV